MPLLAAAYSLWVGGCEDRPPVVMEGRRVAVAPYFDAAVCAGSVAEFDGIVERIEMDSGLDGPSMLTFYWGGRGVDEECPEGAAACAIEETKEVFSLYASLQHELAHMVGYDVGRSELFVEEGFATSHEPHNFCTSVAFAPPPSLRTLVGLSRDDFNESDGAAVSGHFATYLGRVFGPERWSDLKARMPAGSSVAELESAFPDVYGISLNEAEELWTAEAPEVICPGASEPTLVWSGEPLVLEHDLDCDDVTTFGPLDQTITRYPTFTNDDFLEVMYSRDRVLVPFEDRWIVELEGPPGAQALLRELDCTDGAGLPESEDEREFGIGERVEIAVAACQQLVLLTVPPESPGRVRLRIEPSPEGR